MNRYGHGLVIYWHGYVENFGQIDNVHVVDYFPDVWKSPSGEFAEKRLEKNSSYAAFNV